MISVRDTILIFTSRDNPSVETVIAELERMGERLFRFDTDRFPEELFLNLRLSGSILSGAMRQPHGSIVNLELEKVKSCWYRGVAIPQTIRGVEDEGHIRFIQEESKAALWGLYTTLDAFWVNPPLIGSRLLESNRLHQLKAAAAVGLATPETIVTNSPDDLLNFCRECGGVIAVKLLSGHVFVVSDRPDIFAVYTRKISEEDIAGHYESIRLAPVLAQRYVPKKFELRITVVGDRVFACAIDSQASERTRDDWRRYDFAKVKHEQHQLPEQIQSRILEMMHLLKLQFGAIDMIVSPSGEYVFLEVNPQGQWGWIEDLTGMPISRAIAELLMNPPQTK